MTEIVADKTVEVVKNAIKTADETSNFIINISIRLSLADLDKTIKELSHFKQECHRQPPFSRQYKTLLMDSRISLLKQPKQCMNGVMLQRNARSVYFAI
ncbi:hemolysin E [Shigella flexneri]